MGGRTQDALSSGSSPWLTRLFLPVSSHQSTPWGGMAFTAMTPGGAEFKGTSAVKLNPPASAMGAVVLSTSTPAASMKTILMTRLRHIGGSHLASGAETVTESPGFAEEGLTVCSGGKQGGAPPPTEHHNLQKPSSAASPLISAGPHVEADAGPGVQKNSCPHCCRGGWPGVPDSHE